MVCSSDVCQADTQEAVPDRSQEPHPYIVPDRESQGPSCQNQESQGPSCQALLLECLSGTHTRSRGPFLYRLFNNQLPEHLQGSVNTSQCLIGTLVPHNLNLMVRYRPLCLYFLSTQCYTTSQHMTTSPRVFSCICILRYRRQ